MDVQSTSAYRKLGVRNRLELIPRFSSGREIQVSHLSSQDIVKAIVERLDGIDRKLNELLPFIALSRPDFEIILDFSLPPPAQAPVHPLHRQVVSPIITAWYAPSGELTSQCFTFAHADRRRDSAFSLPYLRVVDEDIHAGTVELGHDRR